MTLTEMDWFCGGGGSTQGAAAVPGVEVTHAANHWGRAVETHAANFPAVDHYLGDIREAPVGKWPVCDIFWASPECPQWSAARGQRRDFATSMQGGLFGETGPPEEVERSRALMEEVPLYLRGVQERGGLVKAGVVENVIDVRAWDQWDRWLGEIRKLGYQTRVIALNSMHAKPVRTPPCPQSRDRLYVGYLHRSVGRSPDWDKWLRPAAWCPDCDQPVAAMQVFKKPGTDMGRYRQQYVYRCPHTSCRNAILEPEVLPAAAAIDWLLPGQRIGDRAKPLAPKTLARIEAGLRKYARPITMEAAGNTFERRPGVRTWPVDAPLTTQTTTPTKALAYDPLIVPAGGTWRNEATSAAEPLPARTTRENDGIAIPPAMVMRNNGSAGDGGEHCTPVTEPLRSLTTTGHQSLVAWADLLVPYYSSGAARPVDQPLGALTTRDRYALINGELNLGDVLFRMLAPHEIGRGMAFADEYVVLGTKREQIRQYGNAVTPNVAELLVSALAEAITGRDLPLPEQESQ